MKKLTKTAAKAAGVTPNEIPADQVLSYVRMRLLQHAERIQGLARMSLENGNLKDSLEYAGIAADLDGLVWITRQQ